MSCYQSHSFIMASLEDICSWIDTRFQISKVSNTYLHLLARCRFLKLMYWERFRGEDQIVVGLISSHNICPLLFVNSRIGGCHPALVFCMKILSCLGIRLFPYKESLELLNVIMITRTVTVTENVDSSTIWGLEVIMQFLERS